MSIQQVFETEVRGIIGEETKVIGSGRTDSGVHALGQTVHFKVEGTKWTSEILKRGLNSRLPLSIRVLAAKEVALDFHAQKSATQKQYSYYFQQGPCALPHLVPYSWWIQKRLDLGALNRALEMLKGEHDFKPFQASGSKMGGTTVRKILDGQATFEPLSFPGGAAFANHDFGLVRIRLVGTGFLKQMVRGIAGTLLQIGESRRKAESIQEIFKSKDRSKVGPTAPARALWLERVWYPEVYDLRW